MVCMLSSGSAKVAWCANLPDEQKSIAVEELEEHIQIVEHERSFLRSVVDTTRKDLPKIMILGGKHEPCTYDGLAHYSFDFVQQVHYPSNPWPYLF